MGRKYRKRTAFEEPSYWQSYSDMMAALLLIFILIIAITLAIYKQKTTELDQAKGELESTRSQLQDIVGVRTDIIGQLQSRFNNSSMKVDAQNGSISFSSDVLFKYGSANLTDASKATLTEIIPMYLDVLLQDQFRDYIAEIIIEGHTDTDGSYQHNMELSSERASSVARYILDSRNGLSEAKVQQLQSMLTINGRSYSSPIYEAGTGEIDMAASRRVEIKFRLKEDELIQKITEILGQSTGDAPTSQ